MAQHTNRYGVSQLRHARKPVAPVLHINLASREPRRTQRIKADRPIDSSSTIDRAGAISKGTSSRKGQTVRTSCRPSNASQPRRRSSEARGGISATSCTEPDQLAKKESARGGAFIGAMTLPAQFLRDG